MGERLANVQCAPMWVQDPWFWDDVNQNVESPDLRELAEFLWADRLPFIPRFGFFENLREELRVLYRLQNRT
jgi:hypothetical protein